MSAGAQPYEFEPGDRVIALTDLLTPMGGASYERRAAAGETGTVIEQPEGLAHHPVWVKFDDREKPVGVFGRWLEQIDHLVTVPLGLTELQALSAQTMNAKVIAQNALEEALELPMGRLRTRRMNYWRPRVEQAESLWQRFLELKHKAHGPLMEREAEKCLTS